MIGANSPISERFRDPIETALEEITIERKIVPKYIPVGANTEEEEISAPTNWWDDVNVTEKEEISGPRHFWDYVNFYNNTQLRHKRSLVSVGGAAVTAGKAIAKGAIKEFVFKLSEPILKRMISSKENDVMKNWTNTMLSNTMIASSPTQRNIRYHLDKNDGQSVLTTLQNNKVKYDPYSTTNPIKPGANTDTDTRHAFACRNNIPYVDNLLKECVGSSAMVTNTLVNALFEDIKKTMKAQGISEIQTISSNILQTVIDT